MASIIFLGAFKPYQRKVKSNESIWEDMTNNGLEAIISKGNIIEGIKAKK